MSESVLFDNIILLAKLVLPVIYIIFSLVTFRNQKKVIGIISVVLSSLSAISIFLGVILGQNGPIIYSIIGLLWIGATFLSIKQLRYLS